MCNINRYECMYMKCFSTKFNVLTIELKVIADFSP